MMFEELEDRSVLILGLGVEGLSTYRVLRDRYPGKIFAVADRRTVEQLDEPTSAALEADDRVVLHLGDDYLSWLSAYDVIIKTPGISIINSPAIKAALEAGRITSHTALFFANCPGLIVGVTGTKGKGTTSKLIYEILTAAGMDAHLVGNIGTPPLPLLDQATDESIFVYELSAQQLETLGSSPHIAVLLNIVPDHLDHFAGFEDYLSAKGNLTRYQSERDYLIYNAAFEAPRRIASQSTARLIPCSAVGSVERGYFIEAGGVVCRLREGEPERVIETSAVEAVLPGAFNLHNVIPAVAAAKLLGVGSSVIVDAVGNFKPLEHRFDRVGTYRGITFYNASISTVPEVTIEHMEALGQDVQTMLLGGYDRGQDFSELARRIAASSVRNVILFPETGRRILKALLDHTDNPPRAFFIERSGGAKEAMKKAVRLAFLYTEPGGICLHSPASPSFGLFRDFKERGTLFKRFVRELGEVETGPVSP
jgi:UDP-N-acetylmuramoylalanine--D-glutamate ligase